MSLYDLLPPNATTLERDFSRATSFLQRVGGPVPTIRTAKRVNIPDSVVPWLIYEYGLGELLPYLPDQRRAIAEGVLWQRIRGTPGALKTALNWIDLAATLEESEAGTLRWAEYQLGLDQAPPSLEMIGNVVGIATISQPVRSKLFRVYGGYDERRFILDDHKLGEGLLCDHSGVYNLQPGWPQLSFGQASKALVDALIQTASGYTQIFATQAIYPDRFVLDFSFMDEEWHVLNHPLSLSTTISAGAGDLEGDAQIAPPYQFAKAQIVLSEQWVFGDINHCFPCATQVEVGGTIELSGDAISDTYWALEWEEINERFWQDVAADATYSINTSHPSGSEHIYGATASLGWDTYWDNNTWLTSPGWTLVPPAGSTYATENL